MVMKSTSSQQFAIIGGAGAVGSYFTLMLSNANYNVTAIVRPGSDHTMSIQKQGLIVVTSEGNKTVPAKIFSDNYSHNKQDLIIISLKQPLLDAKVISDIIGMVDDTSVIGIIGNGLPFYFLNDLNLSKHSLEAVDPGGRLIELLKGKCVIGISPLIAANIVDFGITKISRPLDKISVDIGMPNGSRNCDSHDIKSMAELFNFAGIKISVKEQGISQEILKKEQFAITINVLSGITNKTLGEVLYDEQFQPYIRFGTEVTSLISEKLGIGQLRTYSEIKALPITTGHYSSICKDVNENKTPEVKAIIGSLIELSEYLGLNSEYHLKPFYTARKLLELRSHEKEVTVQQLIELSKQSEEALELLDMIPLNVISSNEDGVHRFEGSQEGYEICKELHLSNQPEFGWEV